MVSVTDNLLNDQRRCMGDNISTHVENRSRAINSGEGNMFGTIKEGFKLYLSNLVSNFCITFSKL